MKRGITAMLDGYREGAKLPVTTADLTGQTVIVTGSNTGIGYEAAKHFAQMNPAKLILACRNLHKGNSALARLKNETGFQNAECWSLDLAKFVSVLEFVQRFERESNRLDILVCNAAIGTSHYNVTEDGWEETLQVNNLSTSLLSILLLPRMLDTSKNYPGSKPRIVIVASEVHYWTELKPEVLNSENAFRTLSSKEYCTKAIMANRYLDSKLLNVFFMLSFAELLKNTNIIVNAVNPGYCLSELRRHFSLIQSIVDWFMEKLFAITSEEGSRQLVWSALGTVNGQAESLKGAYINLMRVQEPSDFVLGKEGKDRQDKLWANLVEILAEIDPRVKDVLHRLA